MMRLALTFFGLAVLISPAEALFGILDRDKPIDINPTIQTEESRPYFEKAVASQEKGNYRTALRNYKKVFTKFPASYYSAQSLYNTGIIQFNRKNWKDSFGAFQAILLRHPDYPRFNELVEYQFRIALAQAEGDGVRFMYVFPMRAYNRSIGYFEVVINNAPYSDMAPLALMNVALIHQFKGNTAEAIDALDRLINNYPQSLLADDAYLSLAETFADLVQGPEYDQGATREAISYFEDFLILFSQNQEVARAEQGLAGMEDVYARSKLVIGQYYFKHRRWYQAAEIFFNEAITIAPDSPAADSAREYIARIEKIREDFKSGTTTESAEGKKEKSFIRRWYERIVS
ncbi:MAG TPA: tetratricopeptide repeat protein [Oceanipulchritudo sp.]|nr:tetratricopeptide repeat protein [Oceanipulchritudo sp.]